MRGVIRLGGALALLTAGCSSQAYLQHQRPEFVTTEVVVRTSPPEDATVYFNNVRQATAPVRIPVEYTHVEQLYARQTNWGKTWRESWSWPMKILGAPIWLVGSLFHYREEIRRHTYGGHEHEVSAQAPGYIEAFRVIELEGEERVDVHLELEPYDPGQ